MALEVVSSREMDTEALVVLAPEGEAGVIQRLPGELASLLERHALRAAFTGKKDSTFKLPLLDDKCRLVYLVGMGRPERVTAEDYRLAAARVVKQARRDRITSLTLITADLLDAALSQALTEGAILGGYSFNKYRKPENNESRELERVQIHDGNREGIERGRLTARAQLVARDLANEPGNVINPLTLADWARENLLVEGLECTVFDEQQIQEMGMNGLWYVGKGSSTPPRFIHVCYRPQGQARSRVVLIGKGITFDSGGLDIKPGESMRTMKGDKSGACAVLAVMQALAEARPPVEMHGIVAAAENMPGGAAFRPDDIITARNGKTIEVVSTDAEGRLTLADALSYASELNPDIIIDLATLTGACMVALGDSMAGLFSNDEALTRDLMQSAASCGERLWPLPLDDERLRKKIKSGTADLLNSGVRYGGAIAAALFLQEFVGDGIRWAHIDMAGTDNYKEEFGYYSKGASGYGARLLLDYIFNLDGGNR